MHVDDVAVLQIDLSRTPRPLDHDEVVVRSESRERFRNHRHEARLIFVIFHRRHAADRLALHHDLAASIAFRLEQDRVHVHAGQNAGRLRLHGLRSPDLEAVGGDGRVERHVL